MLQSLNDITTEIESQIEEMAKYFFVPREIAAMLEIDETFLLQQLQAKAGPVYRAFNKGWMQSEYEQRKCIFQLATAGSSPAQTMVLDIRKKAELKLLDQ